MNGMSLRHSYDQTMMPQYSQEQQQQQMLQQHQHHAESLSMTCPLRHQPKHYNLASPPMTCPLRNQQQKHEGQHNEQLHQKHQLQHNQMQQQLQLQHSQLQQQKQQKQQQPMQQQHQHQQQQPPIQQQQYYNSQSQMNPQYNSHPWYYNYGNYGYNYWYNPPQPMNNMGALPANPDQYYQPGQDGSQIASYSGSQDVGTGQPRAVDPQSPMKCFNRIDSYTNVHGTKGQRYRGSEQDLAKYLKVASRTLPSDAPKEWCQNQSHPEPKRHKKVSRKVADSSLGAISSSFLQRIGLFMRFGKTGKQKITKSDDMTSQESSVNSEGKPKKKGFFNRVFGDMPNHPTKGIYSFSDPKSKYQQTNPPITQNDYDQDEVRELDNFRKMRENQISKQPKKHVAYKDECRMPGGT
ncbi:TPR-containing protein DDB_G0280363 isoform X2 [Drosophila ananassae]|uniref:TPR-containing protein DDB_G0280363 isoform X2 n=1 Tax=Drosophila ananassae TaxID=7217 RepID=UPI0013A5CF16|nr:TPR-containing protein DDB_G0280363 isoform X2 [Drosophila ananassae]